MKNTRTEQQTQEPKTFICKWCKNQFEVYIDYEGQTIGKYCPDCNKYFRKLRENKTK